MKLSEITPFGVEAVDVSLGGAFDPEALIAALAEHGVCVFREQDLDDSAFAAALARLGPPAFTTGEEAVSNHPSLNVVSNVGRTTPPRSVFHADTSYVTEPPAFTALKGVAIPQTGGQTVFSDQYAAWERLSDSTRQRLAGATILHGVTGLSADALAGSQSHARHPLVRRHPVSGRDALYLSTPERCSALELSDEHLDDAGSAALIEQLYAHSLEPAGLYRHSWQPGDVVIWDNRCTLHKADHSGVVGDRVMHRGMVQGEAPIAA